MLGTKGLGELNRFVDNRAVGYIKTEFEFVTGKTQDGALYRVNLIDAAIDVRQDMIIEFMQVQWYLAHQLAEVGHIDLAHIVLGQELTLDLGGILPGQLPLVNGLNGIAPGKRSALAHSLPPTTGTI
jgi:hypothetical protein